MNRSFSWNRAFLPALALAVSLFPPLARAQVYPVQPQPRNPAPEERQPEAPSNYIRDTAPATGRPARETPAARAARPAAAPAPANSIDNSLEKIQVMIDPEAPGSRGAAAAPAPRRLPAGSAQTVGMIDEAYFLTKPQLNKRVNRLYYLMNNSLATQKVKMVNEAENKALLIARLEDMVLYEWARQKLMAIQATMEGFTASTVEIDMKIREVQEAQDRDKDGELVKTGVSVINALEMSQEELREYVADAILAEKIVKSRMDRKIPEESYKQIYNLNPAAYMETDAVRLNFLVYELEGTETLTKRREIQKEMEKVRAEAVKAAKKNEFVKYAREFKEGGIGRKIGDYGWANTGSLPKDAAGQSPGTILREIGSLKKGEVSKVLASEFGFYIFQLIEYKPPSGMDYASARPKVESVAYEVAYESVMADVATKHRVYINASGIDLEELQNSEGKTLEERKAELQEKLGQKWKEERKRELEYQRSRGIETASGPGGSTRGKLTSAQGKNGELRISQESLEILRRASEQGPKSKPKASSAVPANAAAPKPAATRGSGLNATNPK